MRTKLVHELRQQNLIIRIREEKYRDVIRYHVSARRLFQNGDLWHESTIVGRDDIPLLRLLFDEAHTWILEREELLTSEANISE